MNSRNFDSFILLLTGETGIFEAAIFFYFLVDPFIIILVGILSGGGLVVS